MSPEGPVRVDLPDDLRKPPQPAPAPRPPTPPVTLLVIAASVIVCLVLNFAPAQGPALMRKLSPSAPAIWHGAVWGLVTTAIVHQTAWHILFNMMWARSFGVLIERDMGSMRYLAFLVAAAFVSSGWQLLTSSETGIGFSGVVYALFGYAWARSRGNPRYAAFVRGGSTIAWMLGWLLLCIVLTVAKKWNVGNAAHVAGLVFGLAVGLVVEAPAARWFGAAGRALGAAFGALALVGAIVSCVWMPWSERWRVRSALLSIDEMREGVEKGDAHAEGQYGNLLAHYPETRGKGLELLRRAAAFGDADAMNGLAWTLATAREDALRDGAGAVEWAERAVAEDRKPEYVDTLAAAFAEAGRWDEAVATQEKLVLGLGPNDAEMRPAYEDHLARFKRQEKVRE